MKRFNDAISFSSTLLLLLLPLISHAHANVPVPPSIPWNVNVDTYSDVETYVDLPPTVFAPNGRLYSVEAAVRACEDDNDQSSNTVLAARCCEGVVVITTSNLSPNVYGAATESLRKDGQQNLHSLNLLIEDDDMTAISTKEKSNHHMALPSTIFRSPFAVISSSTTSPASRSNFVFGVTGGNAVDSQIVRRKLIRIGDYARSSEMWLTVGGAARRFADQQQILTQQGGKGRLLASSVLLMSSQELWRIEPTGQFWQCLASAVGRKSTVIEKLFFDKLLSLYQKKLQTKRKGSKQHFASKITEPNRQELLQFLLDLSIEEVLTLCTQCIVYALRTEDNAKQIQLKAVSLTTSHLSDLGHTVRHYSHKSLQKIATTDI